MTRYRKIVGSCKQYRIFRRVKGISIDKYIVFLVGCRYVRRLAIHLHLGQAMNRGLDIEKADLLTLFSRELVINNILSVRDLGQHSFRKAPAEAHDPDYIVGAIHIGVQAEIQSIGMDKAKIIQTAAITGRWGNCGILIDAIGMTVPIRGAKCQPADPFIMEGSEDYIGTDLQLLADEQVQGIIGGFRGNGKRYPATQRDRAQGHLAVIGAGLYPGLAVSGT